MPVGLGLVIPDAAAFIVAPICRTNRSRPSLSKLMGMVSSYGKWCLAVVLGQVDAGPTCQRAGGRGAAGHEVVVAAEDGRVVALGWSTRGTGAESGIIGRRAVGRCVVVRCVRRGGALHERHLLAAVEAVSRVVDGR